MDLKRLVSTLPLSAGAQGAFNDLLGRFSGSAASETAAAPHRRDLLLLRAMVAAAHADGHLDRAELAAISRRAEQLELDAADRALLFSELAEPWRIDLLAAEARDEDEALAIYLASARTVDAACPAGRLHLDNLAEALALPPQVMRALDERAPAATANAA